MPSVYISILSLARFLSLDDIRKRVSPGFLSGARTTKVLSLASLLWTSIYLLYNASKRFQMANPTRTLSTSHGSLFARSFVIQWGYRDEEILIGQRAPRAKVIVNPAAGARSTRRLWPKIDRLLKHVGLSFDAQFTEGHGHAVEIAREAAGDGYRYVVAVGGDGTVHEVANGILESRGAGDTTMGIISTGTGGDFVRSVGVPRDYVPACSTLADCHRSTIDVGVVEFLKNGHKTRRFFVNAAGLGFDAAVAESTERLPKYFGGTIPYVFGLVRTLAGYRNKNVILRTADSTENRRIVTIVVANGGYYGGGMHVAPEADPRDGRLELMIVGDMGKLALLKAFPSVYKGTHVSHPKVSMSRTSRISIDTSERVLIHADGELIGEGSASFRVIPAALTIAI